MTALAEAPAFFDMSAAPMRIGRVTLKVRDLELVASFYENALGLVRLDTDRSRIVMGAGSIPLLTLEGDSSLAPRDRRETGLFHTAFLLPSRPALASWLGHAAEQKIQIEGASNHGVSEAIYLSDPEGNGIEIYADRPLDEWHKPDGSFHLVTERLDFENLMQDAPVTRWSKMPDGSVIGHIHLQVGDTESAKGFYRDLIGFDLLDVDYPGAAFLGSGGYHHNVGANIWNSRGAGIRSADMAGLGEFEILVQDASQMAPIAGRAGDGALVEEDALVLFDPWGTKVTVRSGPMAG